MITQLLRYSMMKFVFLSVFFATFNSHAGIYEDIKRFVTTDQTYIHSVGIAVGIYSFLCLNHILRSSRFDFDATASIVASFLGACVLSKIAKDYPGYTTVGGVTYGTLRFFDIIKPLF
jgi:hypothetical protein